MSVIRHSAISAVNDPAQSSFSSLEVIVDEVSVVPYSWCYGNAATRKRLNSEMPQKPVLRNFRFFWEIPQNWKMLRDFRIFLRRFLIFKVEVFPLFFEVFLFF